MAKTLITIRNLNNDTEKTFAFPNDQAYIDNEKEKFLHGAEWMIVDIDFDSDIYRGLQRAVRDYIEDHFTFDDVETLFDKIDEMETEAEYTSDVVGLWNEYCYSQENYDDEISYFDEDFIDMVSIDKMDAVRKCLFGEVNYNDEYAKLNGYANIITTNYPVEDWMDEYDLIAWYIEEH